MPPVSALTRHKTKSLILMVDDVAENLQVLGSVLSNAGYQILAATSGPKAIQIVRNKTPDLILLDIMMPGMDGFETCRSLKALPGLHDVPVIFLTALAETAHIVQGFEIGGVDYVTKPFNAVELLARIRSHVELRSARKALLKYAEELEREIGERARAEETLRKLSSVVEQTDDAIFIAEVTGVIVYVNPAFERRTGYSRAEALGKTPRLLNSGRHEPAFFATLWHTILAGEIYRGVVINRCKDGTFIHCQKTITPIRDETGAIVFFSSIDKDITQWHQAQERIRYMALHDILTDLANRVLLAEQVAQALANTQRQQTHGALLYLDLDGFKPINDTYGHTMGDAVLKEVAQRLQGCAPEPDTVARVGGDEFVVLLRHIDRPEEAEALAQTLLERLRAPYQACAGHCRVGASIGIALFPEHGTDADTLLRRADQAMYRAKSAGKQRYVLAEDANG